MVAEEDGAFPVEQSLAPTVVESNVPERTRRRGEYGARVSGRKITVSFFLSPSPLKQQEQTKPEFFWGGFTESSHHKEEGSEGLEPQVFFFFFHFFLLLLLPPHT